MIDAHFPLPAKLSEGASQCFTPLPGRKEASEYQLSIQQDNQTQQNTGRRKGTTSSVNRLVKSVGFRKSFPVRSSSGQFTLVIRSEIPSTRHRLDPNYGGLQPNKGTSTDSRERFAWTTARLPSLAAHSPNWHSTNWQRKNPTCDIAPRMHFARGNTSSTRL